MKTKHLLTILALCFFDLVCLHSQIPQGFNYQAIAKDGNSPIANQSLPVRITIQADSLGTSVIWQELHSSVTTNGSGMFTLILGKGSRQAASTVAAFSDINWSISPKFVKSEIYYSGWKTMGVSRFWSVPYSLNTANLTGTLSKLAVKGNTAINDEALFEVRNKDGQILFAVYNEGVRVYVSDGAKGLKGGFAVGGFGTDKAVSTPYFVVGKDSVRVYLDTNPLTKGLKGGFAVGGYDLTKGIVQNYLDVSGDSIRMYVDKSLSKASNGGFAVGGFGLGKANQSLFINMTPKNYFIGEGSGSKNTTGLYNSLIGYNAGMENTTGNSNVFLGNESGKLNSSGSSNLFLGYQSGYSNTSGSSNLFIGYQSGYSNTTGNENDFFGYRTGYSNTTGAGNLFVGHLAGLFNTTGNSNTFIGYASGAKTSTGYDNTFIGSGSGGSNTIGYYNIFIGRYTGWANIDGFSNIFIGNEAGSSNTNGYANIFIGTACGKSTTTGLGNLFLGNYSGWWNSTGSTNLFIGGDSGNKNTEGSNNTFIGQGAGYLNTIGNNNTSVGYYSGNKNLTGSGNVFLGNYAGFYETGSNKLFIDNQNRANEADARVKSLIYGIFDGNPANQILTINGKVGIGTTAPNYTLDVRGTIGNNTTLYHSDVRWKRDISQIRYDIDDIKKLSGVSYSWNANDYPDMGFDEGTQFGFIAQEFEKVIPELVKTGKDGYKSIDYVKLTPILVEAIKEQQKQIESYKSQLQTLQEEVEQIKAMLKKR